MTGLRFLHGRRAARCRVVLGATGVSATIGLFSGLGASSAVAGPLELGLCNGSTLSQPFLPWGDPTEYELAPDGTFIGGGWRLDNGALIASGTGPLGSGSSVPVLSPAPGASALSAPTCVDAAYPSVRMFIAGTGAIAVSVVYHDLVLPAGIASAGGGWEPTLPMVTWSAIPGALAGGTATVSLLLTGLSGQPVIDDVYVDPWYRG